MNDCSLLDKNNEMVQPTMHEDSSQEKMNNGSSSLIQIMSDMSISLR